MNAPQIPPEDSGRSFKAIDEMVERVNQFKRDPAFKLEVERRAAVVPDLSLKDEKLLERMIILIAYSNNAQAKKVTTAVDEGAFRRAFLDYSVEKVAQLDPETVLQAHWNEIQAVRFKYKVEAMVKCARCLLPIRERHGSFMGYLRSTGLPAAVKSEADIQSFWAAFSQIQKYFRDSGVPYFPNLTSLCHLLLDLGFDCAKPDSAVMTASVKLGIVPAKRNPNKSRPHPERDLRKTVETIQAYAISRSTRAPVTDLYFLIRGGQTWASELVKPEFYR